MSLLEWSFSNHSLVTVSIHYYERDDYKVNRAQMDREGLVAILFLYRQLIRLYASHWTPIARVFEQHTPYRASRRPLS